MDLFKWLLAAPHLIENTIWTVATVVIFAVLIVWAKHYTADLLKAMEVGQTTTIRARLVLFAQLTLVLLGSALALGFGIAEWHMWHAILNARDFDGVDRGSQIYWDVVWHTFKGMPEATICKAKSAVHMLAEPCRALEANVTPLLGWYSWAVAYLVIGALTAVALLMTKQAFAARRA